ncbi:hypothetical protein [Nonomuraea cavernae]|uniref:hypothetical protein n=1 Tax=Nonomuraea cavernae TaxID=2045107 RepID=UPI00166CFD26|nr:hypothetical protein [Nonomuraea cavernae]MCA2190878.1 hypothetical protein [Nonomuraea cavernae]
MALHDAVERADDDSGEVARQVVGHGAAGQTDDDQDAARDARHGLLEFAGEHALSAADIEGVPGVIRDRAQDARVVVDVVAPTAAVFAGRRR